MNSMNKSNFIFFNQAIKKLTFAIVESLDLPDRETKKTIQDTSALPSMPHLS